MTRVCSLSLLSYLIVCLSCSWFVQFCKSSWLFVFQSAIVIYLVGNRVNGPTDFLDRQKVVINGLCLFCIVEIFLNVMVCTFPLISLHSDLTVMGQINGLCLVCLYCLQTDKSSSQCLGIAHALRSVLREDPRALYKGWSPYVVL